MKADAYLTIAVLGVPVHFRSGHPELVQAVEEVYGRWTIDDLNSPSVQRLKPTPRVRLSLAPDGYGGLERMESAEGRDLEIRTQPGSITAKGKGMSGSARLDALEATCRVTASALSDRPAFGELLDTFVLSMVSRLDRQPVHAAAVEMAGSGLVLAGRGGIGKSTLAYAAHLQGFRVLGDDTVYVQLDPRLRVWTMGTPLHLSPSSLTWFPEITDRPLTRRPSGAWKHVVDLGEGHRPLLDLPGTGRFAVMDRVGLCLLERTIRATERTSVRPLGSEQAIETLLSRLEPGFDAFRETIATRLRAVAQGGCWLVSLGQDPCAAAAELAAVVEMVSDPSTG